MINRFYLIERERESSIFGIMIVRIWGVLVRDHLRRGLCHWCYLVYAIWIVRPARHHQERCPSTESIEPNARAHMQSKANAFLPLFVGFGMAFSFRLLLAILFLKLLEHINSFT